jgi:hypothetical protein
MAGSRYRKPYGQGRNGARGIKKWNDTITYTCPPTGFLTVPYKQSFKISSLIQVKNYGFD